MSSNVPNTIKRDSKESSMESKGREMLASTFKTMLKKIILLLLGIVGTERTNFIMKKNTHLLLIKDIYFCWYLQLIYPMKLLLYQFYCLKHPDCCGLFVCKTLSLSDSIWDKLTAISMTAFCLMRVTRIHSSFYGLVDFFV